MKCSECPDRDDCTQCGCKNNRGNGPCGCCGDGCLSVILIAVGILLLICIVGNPCFF